MSQASDEVKSDLRDRMRRVLADLGPESRHDASAAACLRLATLDAFQHASVVMLYMPLPTELDLTAARATIRERLTPFLEEQGVQLDY